IPGLFAVCGSMAFGPRTPRSEPLDLSSVPLDCLVQFFVVAVLDQVSEDLQDPARAAVESQLSAGQITLAQASLDRRSLIDYPEAPQRKGSGHGGDSARDTRAFCAMPEVNPHLFRRSFPVKSRLPIGTPFERRMS